MNIEIRKNMVYLYCPGANSPVDYFRKSDIARTLQIGQYEISEYIYLLSQKSWMRSMDLYRLAVLIQKEFPQNKINWEETFYPIEKSIFIDNQWETEANNRKVNSAFDTIMKKIQLGRDVGKEASNDILKNLRRRLKEYGLK